MQKANIQATELSTELSRASFEESIYGHATVGAQTVPQYYQQGIPIPPTSALQQLPPPPSVTPHLTTQQEFFRTFFSVNTPLPITNQPSSSKSRKRRTCRRCGNNSDICKGSLSVNNCTRPCQDCQKGECEGRDPKSPDKTCVNSGNKHIRG